MGPSRHDWQIYRRRHTFSEEKQLTLPAPSLSSRKGNLQPNGLGLDLQNDAGWYTAWLISQWTKLPSHTVDLFHTDHKNCSPESHWGLFTQACLRVADCIASMTEPLPRTLEELLARKKSTITIDKIIGDLVDGGILAPETPKHNLNHARYFVFTIIGFQTMLYSPAPLDSASGQPTRLCIPGDPGCCMYTHGRQEIDIQECARESLCDLLEGFGVLLPSKNQIFDGEKEVNKAFHREITVHTNIFNANALHYIAGVKIKWTDALACHLEFNATTKELSVFRFPSFCHCCLAGYEHGKGRGVIYACARTDLECRYWAWEEDINHLLLEVILSYRLLFGQTKRSRKLFRSMDPFSRYPGKSRKMRDPLLSTLCGSRYWGGLDFPSPDWHLVDKEAYCLPLDFPILRYRIFILQKLLSTTAPRTWLQMWMDNRDSANWMTFWAVILFGAFGSLMALLQVILQFVQLFV